MKLVKGLALTALGVACLTGLALAGENSTASLLVHVAPHTTKNQCTTAPTSCEQVNTSAVTGSFYDIILMVANPADSNGLAGVEFGIDYNGTLSQGIDIFEWKACGDLEFPMTGWPTPGTGNVVTWNASTCLRPTEQVRVVGRFYIGAYSADRFQITPRPASGVLAVASCSAEVDDLTSATNNRMGYADFGSGLGYNPCTTVVPVQESTWSGVKILFR